MRIVDPVVSPVSEALNWQSTFPVTVDRSSGSNAVFESFARFDGGGRSVVIVRAPGDKRGEIFERSAAEAAGRQRFATAKKKEP